MSPSWTAQLTVLLLESLLGGFLPRFASSDRSMAIAPSSSASCSLRIDEKEGARWIPPSKSPHGRTSVRSAGSLLIGSTLTKRQSTTSVRSAARSRDPHELPVPSPGSPPTRGIRCAHTHTGRHKQGSQSQGIPRSDHAWQRDALRGSRSTTHRSFAGLTNQSLRNAFSRPSDPRQSQHSRGVPGVSGRLLIN